MFIFLNLALIYSGPVIQREIAVKKVMAGRIGK